MKISLLQKIILIGILIITANGLLGYSIYKNNQTIDDTHQLLKKSEEVVKHSNLILSRIKDVETAARGYVISKDSVFLEPLNQAKSKMLVSLDQLKFLTVNNPSQRRRVDSLDSYVDKRLDVSIHMIDLRNKEGLNAAVNYVSSLIGKNFTDSIRKTTNSINEEERFILQQQSVADEQDEADNDRLAVTLFLLMSFFTVLLLIVTVNYLYQNQIKLLRASELIIANTELKFQNEEKGKRASELIIANTELKFQNEEKGKRAEELLIANVELAFQNKEKGKRAEELLIANAELAFQNEEKGKRADELLIANKELSNAKVYLKRYIKGLEEMITMTSHKVRVPIANILGLAEALQESLSSPLELKQIIIYIKESALKLDVFTKELTIYMVNLNQKKR
jgi:CHASE3 domain sensor protein